jgi:hypothetical protein
MTPEIRNLLKEARTIIRAHARWSAKDWDERATKALATPPAAQHTWVDLTEQEALDCFDPNPVIHSKNVAAKLKEKNT